MNFQPFFKPQFLYHRTHLLRHGVNETNVTMTLCGLCEVESDAVGHDPTEPTHDTTRSTS